jgi:hypothetical protein
MPPKLLSPTVSACTPISRHPGEGRDPVCAPPAGNRPPCLTVIPAKAGIQFVRLQQATVPPCLTVIPAQAGIPFVHQKPLFRPTSQSQNTSAPTLNPPRENTGGKISTPPPTTKTSHARNPETPRHSDLDPETPRHSDLDPENPRHSGLDPESSSAPLRPYLTEPPKPNPSFSATPKRLTKACALHALPEPIAKMTQADIPVTLFNLEPPAPEKTATDGVKSGINTLHCDIVPAPGNRSVDWVKTPQRARRTAERCLQPLKTACKIEYRALPKPPATRHTESYVPAILLMEHVTC